MGRQASVIEASPEQQAYECLWGVDRRYDLLLQTMHEGVCLHEIVRDHCGRAIDYRILEVNPAYERITGLKRYAVIRRKASEAYGTGEAPYLSIYAQVVATGQPATFETHFPPMNKHFTVSVFTAKPETFVTVFTDITVHKRTAEELLQANEKLQRAVRRRDMVNSIAKAVNARLDVSGIYALAVEKLRRSVQCDAVKISRVQKLDEEGAPAEWRIAHVWTNARLGGAAKAFLTQGPTVRGPMAAGRAAYLTGKAVYVADTRRSLGNEGAADVGILSLIKAPLSRESRTIGTLNVYSADAAAFLDDDVALLADVARHLAIAIENAESCETIRREVARQGALERISLAMTATLDAEEIYDVVVNEAVRVLPCDVFYLAEVTEWGDGWSVKGIHHRVWLSERVPVELRGFWEQKTITFENQQAVITQRAYKSGETQLVVDSREEAPESFAARGGLLSLVKTPVNMNGTIVGTLTAGSLRPRAFDDGDERLLTALAAHFGQAVRNAELHSAERRRSEELRLLNELSTSLVAITALGELMDRALGKMAEGVGPECVIACFLLAADGQALELKGLHNASPEADEDVRAFTRWKLAQLPDFLSTVVLEDQPYLLVNGDDAQDPRVQALVQRGAIKSLAVVPLRAGGEVLGALAVITDRRNFTEREMQWLASAGNQLGLAVRNVQAFGELRQASLETILAFGRAVEAYDPYTAGHSKAVTEHALRLATQMRVAEADMEYLRTAGLLHDIGKIGMPESVLNKPTRLTQAEYAMIKMHSTLGAAIVSGVAWIAPAVPVIRHHHERWDGLGYPDALKGEEIPLLARILAVADGYDAIISERPYRQPRTHEQAVAILRAGAGSQWDPAAVEAFLSVQQEPVVQVPQEAPAAKTITASR